jgi:hypothetical protein
MRQKGRGDLQRLLIALITLVVAVTVHAFGESIPEPQSVNYCEVVTLPKDYDDKVLSVDVVLVPGEHTLSLFGADCLHLGYDRVTEAQLPNNWTALPNGSALSRILRRHLSAKVKLIGTFDSSRGPYGPDGARFRFSISRIISVSKTNVSVSTGQWTAPAKMVVDSQNYLEVSVN